MRRLLMAGPARRAGRIGFGVLLIGHGLAHALAGMQVMAGATSWLLHPLGAAEATIRWTGWFFWCIALVGLVVAGSGWLGLPVLRRAARPLTLIGTAASLILMMVFWPVVWSAAALVIDGLVLVVLSGRPATIGLAPPPPPRARAVRVLIGVGQGVAATCILWLTLVAVTTPWRNYWGSTAAELRAALPGDEPLARAPTYWLQHAVTIRAPAAAVWPWLAQLGTDRAGFYSYSALEHLFGVPVHNADRIHPEWQDVRSGGFIQATPAGYLGIDHPLGWRLREVQAPRVLVLENWGAFVLVPVDSGTTRFIIRTRNSAAAGLTGIVMAWAGLTLFEPAHFIMQRGMMLGVKRRAERQYVAAD